MTYPQQPPQGGYPNGGFVPPTYPPQQAPPQQYAYPPQAPPQQYAQYPPQAPVPPAAPGSLDAFYSQPSSAGGPSLKFNGRPIGTSYSFVVARAITDNDVRQQTDQSGRPVTFKDGRAKWILVVPIKINPSQEFPEGTASWWVKGQANDELTRAMAEAGAPAGPPEAGAAISVTLVGHRPIPGMNPAHIYQIRYLRPAGAAPVEQAKHEPAQVPAQPDVQAPQQVQQPVPTAPVPQQAPPVHQPAPAPQQAAQPSTDGMSAEQLALLQKLTGG